MAKQMCWQQMVAETGPSSPDEMRGDYSQSDLCCFHVVSTIKSEVMAGWGWEELTALQSDGLSYSHGFTSVVFWINH